MSKKRAFVRYTKSGEIVPGSLIITTNGGYPDKSSLWKEVTVDQCCPGNGGDCTPQLSDKIVTTELELPFPYISNVTCLITLNGTCNNYTYVQDLISVTFLNWDDVVTFLNTNFSFFGLFSYVAPNTISLQISSVGLISSCSGYTLSINFSV